MDEPQWLNKCLNTSTPLEEVISEIKTNLSPKEGVTTKEVERVWYEEPGFSQCGYSEDEMRRTETIIIEEKYINHVPHAGRYLSRILKANSPRRKELLKGLKGHSVYQEVPILDKLRSLF